MFGQKLTAYAGALFDNDPALEQRLQVAQWATPGLLTMWSGIDCWDYRNFIEVVEEDYIRLQVLRARPGMKQDVNVAGL